MYWCISWKQNGNGDPTANHLLEPSTGSNREVGHTGTLRCLGNTRSLSRGLNPASSDAADPTQPLAKAADTAKKCEMPQ